MPKLTGLDKFILREKNLKTRGKEKENIREIIELSVRSEQERAIKIYKQTQNKAWREYTITMQLVAETYGNSLCTIPYEYKRSVLADLI